MNFVVLLTIWKNILRSFNLVSKKLQSSNIHLHNAYNYLKEATSSITNLRDKYEEFVNSSNIVCNGWGYRFNLLSDAVFIQNDFLTMLMVIEDLTLLVTSENFRVLVFLPIIDTAIVQLRERFNGLYEVTIGLIFCC